MHTCNVRSALHTIVTNYLLHDIYFLTILERNKQYTVLHTLKYNDYNFSVHVLYVVYNVFTHQRASVFSWTHLLSNGHAFLCNCESLQIKKTTIFKHIPSVRDELEMSWSEWCHRCLLKDRCPVYAGQSMSKLTTVHLTKARRHITHASLP